MSSVFSEQDALAFLETLHGRGIRPDVAPFKAALAELLPSRLPYPTVLIAGTNGKGSTAAMTAHALQGAGYRVGLLSSPHLLDVRERIQIDGGAIDRKAFASGLFALSDCVARHHLTYYETLVLLGFYHFAKIPVEVAVLEVGMGGRFDATNAVDPLACAVTSVDFDHEAILGHTLKAIATEKAGIARPGIPLVNGAHAPDAQAAIAAACQAIGAPIFAPEPSPPMPLYLHGAHQRANAAVAYTLLMQLKKFFPRLTDEKIRIGIETARWPGRLEKVFSNPDIFLDGAHNPAGMRALRDFSTSHYPGEKAQLIFSVMKDKNYRAMSADWASWVERVHYIALPEARALSYEDFSPVSPVPITPLALDLWNPEFCQNTAPHSPWFCCGSLYLVGEIAKIRDIK